jgi:hypothetical protein
MDPVRVKILGVPLTRRRYLVAQAMLMVFLILLALLRPLVPTPRLEAHPAPLLAAMAWPLAHFTWIVLGALVVDGIEVLCVLRRFAREEALQRGRAADVASST